MNIWKELSKKAIENPSLILPGAVALLNGYWHKLKFKLCFKRVYIGNGFRVYGSFDICGSGATRIGDNCVISSKMFKKVSLTTFLPEAAITIGNNVQLNGTTISCFKKISIDDFCIISDAYIVDSQGHHISADRRFRKIEEVPSAPVIISKNVWISTNVVVSYGVTIGENSVIGALSLIRKNIPANCLYAGVPAIFIKTIPSTFEDYINTLNSELS